MDRGEKTLVLLGIFVALVVFGRRKVTKGRFLWLRNNASTIVSQFLDTMIFMFVAFFLAAPQYTVEFIFALIIPYWLLKVVIAVADAPLVYLGVRWLGGEAPEEAFG